MKKILFFLFAVVLSSGVQAQDKKAEKLLDDVSAKAKSYDNMVIQFDYIQEEDPQTRQETKGTVSLKKDKYKLELMGTTRIFDGEKLYDIIPEDEEINISKHNPKDESELSPSKLLNFYEKGYDYEWDIEQNVEGRKVQYVKLTPEKDSTDVRQVLLGIDIQTKHIAKMIQEFKDETKVEIKVKSFKTNQPLAENLFKFNENKYQGYYINRLD